MRHCPADTVKAWIKMDRLLDPKKLIPSLIQCNAPPEQSQHVTKAAIEYLEFCVHKLHNTERAIHNFLVSSYTQSKESGVRNRLLSYLQEQAKVIVIWPSCDYLNCPIMHSASSGMLWPPVCPETVSGAEVRWAMCPYLCCYGPLWRECGIGPQGNALSHSHSIHYYFI